MIASKSNTFWKQNSKSEKVEIIQDFKNYINIKNKEKIPYNKILELMIQDMRYIAENQENFTLYNSK